MRSASRGTAPRAEPTPTPSRREPWREAIKTGADTTARSLLSTIWLRLNSRIRSGSPGTRAELRNPQEGARCPARLAVLSARGGCCAPQGSAPSSHQSRVWERAFWGTVTLSLLGMLPWPCHPPRAVRYQARFALHHHWRLLRHFRVAPRWHRSALEQPHTYKTMPEGFSTLETPSRAAGDEELQQDLGAARCCTPLGAWQRAWHGESQPQLRPSVRNLHGSAFKSPEGNIWLPRVAASEAKKAEQKPKATAEIPGQ